MKIKYSILVVCFIAFIYGQMEAQVMKIWDHRYGANGQEELRHIVKTTDHGFFLAGWSMSDAGGDISQANKGVLDYWVMKADEEGALVWEKRYGGNNVDELTCARQTPDGGFIIGGYTYSTVSGDITQASYSTVLQEDYWVAKLDANGAVQWNKRYGGHGNDQMKAIAFSTTGGYYFGGSTTSDSVGDILQHSRGWTDFWVVKTDATGNILWSKLYGGNFPDVMADMIETSDGGVLIGGYSSSIVSGEKTDPNFDVTQTTSDFWLVKLLPNGNVQWDQTFGGTDQDILYSLCETPGGAFMAAGKTLSNVSGTVSHPTRGGWDYWLVKFNNEGTLIWDKRYGGSEYEDDVGYIRNTTNNGFLLSGSSYSPVSGEKTEDNLATEQGWVLKLDSLGVKEWDRTMLTQTPLVDEWCFGIQADDGCYLFANYTRSPVAGYVSEPNFEPGLTTHDYWVVKFCDTTGWNWESVEELRPAVQSVPVFPNPTFEAIRGVVPSGEGQVGNLEMYDISGRLIQQLEILLNGKEFTLPVLNLPSGIYFLKLTVEKRTYHSRFIKG